MKTNSFSLKDYIFHLALQYKVYIFSLIGVAIAAGVFEISVDYKVKEIVDVLSINKDSDLTYLLVLFVFYQFMQHAVYFINRLLDIKYKPKLIEQTVLDVYSKTVRHSIHWFDSHLSGEISNKIFEFQNSITNIINYILSSINGAASIAIMILFLFGIHSLSAVVFLVFVVVYIPIIYLLLAKQKTLNESSDKVKQKTIDIVNDSIINNSSVQLSGSLPEELRLKLKPAIANWRGRDKKAREFDAYVVDNADTIMATLMGAVQIYFLAYLYRKGGLTAGDFAFIAMMTLKVQWKLSTFVDDLFNISPSFEKIKFSYEYVGSKLNVEDRDGAYVLSHVRGKINYSNVTFAYDKDKRQVLSDFNLDIRPGEHIGIVGLSGAGKTTLVKCLLRYFDVDSGSVSIDRHNIKDITLQSLRDSIFIIPKDITMFHRSIRENLRLAKYNATDEELVAACKKANIHKEIIKMPEGYDSIVGERGLKLSAGQRQRIAIARAILKDAPILILDESTSVLDTATERLIQNAINKVLETSKTTVIAIAHRPDTIKHMDRIIVLDNGKIVEEGDHNSLIRRNGGFYKKLWEMQAI